MEKKLNHSARTITPETTKARKTHLPSLRPGIIEGLMSESTERRFALSALEMALYRLTCTINAMTTPIQDAVIALMKELGAEEATIHLSGRSNSELLDHYITIRRDGEMFSVTPLGEGPGYISTAAFTDRSLFFSVPRARKYGRQRSTLYKFNMIPGDTTFSRRDIKNGDKQICSVPLFMSENRAGIEVSKKLGVLTLKGKSLNLQESKQTGSPAVEKVALLVACAARVLSRIIDARFDPLTGLLKRPEYDAQLNKQIAEYIAGGPNFAVLMLDLDHFKDINDTYGHDAGDIALRTVAEAMSRKLRGYRKGDVQERRLGWHQNDIDYCYRWGGEELAVILPATTMDEARAIAERIRETIKNLRINAGGAEFGVSISVGVGDADSVIGREHHDTDIENLAQKLTHNVDFALYAAKRGGRNMVAYAEKDQFDQLQYLIYTESSSRN